MAAGALVLMQFPHGRDASRRDTAWKPSDQWRGLAFIDTGGKYAVMYCGRKSLGEVRGGVKPTLDTDVYVHRTGAKTYVGLCSMKPDAALTIKLGEGDSVRTATVPANSGRMIELPPAPK